MSQISMPMRILLVGAVVFLAAWFTVMRPKAETVEPSTTSTTATTAPSETKSEAATTSKPDAKPAPATAIPAAALKKLPKDVRTAVEARKVIVLGVIADGAKPWRPLADDDRYVRNALDDVNTYKSKVFVKSVPVGKLAGYGALVNGLGVNQTPSIVVIDRDLRGTVLTGYVDKVSINQVIADARDASIEPDIKDPFLRDVNTICGDMNVAGSRWSLPTVKGHKPRLAAYKRLQTIIHRYDGQIARLDAPAKYKRFKALWVKAMKVDVKYADDLVKAGKTRRVSDDIAVITKAQQGDKRWNELDRRANELGVTSCQSNRSA